jgi:hypothetical protein
MRTRYWPSWVSQSTSCTVTPSANEQQRPLPLARRSNHGLSGELANRPSSRANSWPDASVVRQNAESANALSLHIVASIDGCRVVFDPLASDVPNSTGARVLGGLSFLKFPTGEIDLAQISFMSFRCHFRSVDMIASGLRSEVSQPEPDCCASPRFQSLLLDNDTRESALRRALDFDTNWNFGNDQEISR